MSAAGTAAGQEVPVDVRPPIQDRFPVAIARELMKGVLKEKVAKADKVTAQLTHDIAETTRSRLKELCGQGSRYKIFVHVVLGEGQGKTGDAPPRGAGIHVASRCLWDPAVDDQVTETVGNDALFAVATAYAMYGY